MSKMHLISETIENNKFELILDEKYDALQSVSVGQGSDILIIILFKNKI